MSSPFSGLDLILTPARSNKLIHTFLIIYGYTGDMQVNLFMNGKQLEADDYKTGLVRKSNTNNLYLWINREISSITNLQLE